jgi:hypothetical protein
VWLIAGVAILPFLYEFVYIAIAARFLPLKSKP